MDSDDDYNFDSDFSWWEPHLTWRATWCWICSRLDFKMICWLSGSITFFILTDRENVFLLKNKSNIMAWRSRLKHREADSCSLRKQLAFRDTTTGFPAKRRMMNERPQPSMAFLRSLLPQTSFRRETSGGFVKCRLFSKAIVVGTRQKKKTETLIYMLFVSIWTDVVANMDPSLRASAIGHLRVTKTLTFKVRLSAQHFSWKWVLFAWERKIISISKAEHLTSFWYRGPGELGTYCHWDQVVTEEARCF